MNFRSDNVYGTDPRIMAAIVAANHGTAASYCHDDGAKESEALLSRIFETEVKSYFVVNGTAANSLALSAIAPSHGGILCHENSHVSTDECNAPAFFTGGAKLFALPGEYAKIRPQTISAKLASFVHGEHGAKPTAVSITNSTELGTVYSPAEIAAIAAVAKPYGIKIHMDGSRFANALVSVGCSPAELTWKSGVDVLSFGGTKNGGMMLEAVVFFDPALADDFLYRRKRAGQLVSKGRFLSAQMLAYLDDDVWLANARHANRLAGMLARGLEKVRGVRLSNPVEANEVFAFMPRSTFEFLTVSGANFHEWIVDDTPEDERHCRFVLSFATPEEDVMRFLALMAEQG